MNISAINITNVQKPVKITKKKLQGYGIKKLSLKGIVKKKHKVRIIKTEIRSFHLYFPFSLNDRLTIGSIAKKYTTNIEITA